MCGKIIDYAAFIAKLMSNRLSIMAMERLAARKRALTTQITMGKALMHGRLLDKQVILLDAPRIGRVIGESRESVTILGSYDYEFTLPKSLILSVRGEAVIIGIEFHELFKYMTARAAVSL